MRTIFLVSADEFLRRDVRGVHSLSTTSDSLAELCEAWNRDRSRNILIDLRNAEIDFSPTDVRSHVAAVLETGIGRHRRVAIVYRARPGFDAVRFFEFLIARFSELQLKSFEDFEEGMIWLSTITEIEVEANKNFG